MLHRFVRIAAKHFDVGQGRFCVPVLIVGPHFGNYLECELRKIRPNLITFQRTRLRPWAFFALDDKSLRDELFELFPDGAYVAFADDYCESRNENMDDHWRALHALPGDGSSGRPALGDVLISVQERFNTLSNLQNETYGIPPIYANSEVLEFDSVQNQTAEPRTHYPARARSLASRSPRDFSSRSLRRCRPTSRSTPRT
ncbi:MAG: hypothetical protein ABR953_02610 [Candidatus Acidiferrales bacterium]